MAFTPKVCSLFLVALFAVCMQPQNAQFIPGARCVCHRTIKFTPLPIVDFQVIEKGPSCDATQVIVTIAMADNSQEAFCLNTEGKLAKAFLQCWNRINRDESQKMTCLNKWNKPKRK